MTFYQMKSISGHANQALGDSELVSAVIKGDHKAFEILVTRHLSNIARYIFWLTNASASEDIAQEVFLKVWQKLSSFRSDSSFKAWIYRIAHNQAIDWMRRTKETPVSLMADETIEDFESVQDESPTVEVLIDHELDAHELQAAISKLKPNERAVLIMRYREDLSFPEISTVLEMPLEKIKAQHYRALKKLKNILIQLS